MYVRVLKSHHHFFLWSAISNHTGRSVAEGLQQWCSVYTKGIHTHIYMSQGWVFFFFFQENQGKGNKQDLLTWITLSWSACYKTDCLWCHWKLQNEVFFWRQAGLLDEISVQAARISEICPAHLLVKTHYKFYEETRHELSSWTRLAHLIDTFWYFNGISSY